MKLVVVESPFASTDRIEKQRFRVYLQWCLLDSIWRGESPYASHGFHTHFLDDNNPQQRKIGIECGLAWGDHGDLRAVYKDFGVSPGMTLGVERAVAINQPLEERTLGKYELGLVYKGLGPLESLSFMGPAA